MRTRLLPADRRASILEAAVSCARREGFDRMSRDGIAREAGCATGLISHYFANMMELRTAVMNQAVADGIVSIVADGLRERDPIARKAPRALRDKAQAMLDAR